MRHRGRYIVIGLAAAAILALTAASQPARADEPLRWKFEVGEKLDYSMVQEMTMSADGDQNSVKMRQEMDMTWNVQGVDKETGEAVIKQKFERMKLKVTSPKGMLDYDSKSEAPPTGLAAMIAPLYKAMTKDEFEITMTSRGEVKDVKIPEEVLSTLKSSPGAGMMGEAATENGFKEMLSKGALVLPKDPPMNGESWKTKVEMNNPTVGKQTVETTYRYEGTKELDGTTYAVIRPEMKIEFENMPEKPPGPGQPQAAPQRTMKIADQSSTGEVLFNIAKGRLYSMTLEQKVSIDATEAGKTSQRKIEQKIDVKVTPAGETKPEEVKKPEANGDK